MSIEPAATSLASRWPVIAKKTGDAAAVPNLCDYDRARHEFSWAQARTALDGLPGGAGLNIAHEAVDRHVRGPRARRVALRWVSKEGARRDLTYADLAEATNRFANVLRRLGVGKGDVVAVLSGRIPELYIAALGAVKNGSIFAPLFSAFGPEPIQTRLDLARAKVLVTTDLLYQRKVEALRRSLPGLEHVLLVGEAGGIRKLAGTRDLRALLAEADHTFTIPPTHPEDVALLHFTSGTTGKPKGALHVHEAVVAHHATARFALDLHPDDVFWCTADPGGIMIANFAALDIRPGSMGRPLPGIDAAIVRRTGEDTIERLDTPGAEGELALQPGWPSMFRGYLGDEARYRRCFAGGFGVRHHLSAAGGARRIRPRCQPPGRRHGQDRSATHGHRDPVRRSSGE